MAGLPLHTCKIPYPEAPWPLGCKGNRYQERKFSHLPPTLSSNVSSQKELEAVAASALADLLSPSFRKLSSSLFLVYQMKELLLLLPGFQRGA